MNNFKMKYKVDVPKNFEDEQLNLYLNLLIEQGQLVEIFYF